MTDLNLDLPKILDDHKLWMDGVGGSRADLRGALLRDAYLGGALLRDAYLSGADLRNADLRYADLRKACLIGADLRGADLRGADLRGAELCNADLRDAYLSDAFLRGADLRGAFLSAFFNCPEKGDFTAWKKLGDGLIAELVIPASAARTSSLVGRKNRAEFVMVIAIVTDGGNSVTEGFSTRDGTKYTVGEIVRPDKYDPDIKVECTNGIHFFITKREAEEY